MRFIRAFMFKKIVRLSLVIFCETMCLLSYAASTLPVGETTSDAPDDKAVDALVGDVKFKFVRDYYDTSMPISDRIMDGFQAAPRSLRVDEGTTIYWGFKYQEATIASIAIADATGRIRLVGAVSNIVSLARHSGLISTDEEYQKKIKAAMVNPASLILFVGDDRDLASYLPLVKRWLQADLLGMNVDCDSEKKMAACKFAEDIQISITAYQVADSGKEAHQLHTLSIPSLPTASTPIKWFTQ